MKKLLIFLFVTAFSVTSFAQFGIQAGVTFATFKLEDKSPGGTNPDTKSKVSYTFGIVNDFHLSTNLVFEPGVNILQKKCELSEKVGTTTYKNEVSLDFIEIPLNFIYKATGGFFVGAGPALGFITSGKLKHTQTPTSTSNPDGTEKLKIGSDKANDDVKAFEFSGNLLAGYGFTDGMYLAINYNLGLSELAPDKQYESKKTRYLGVTLGYKLGGKKDMKKK